MSDPACPHCGAGRPYRIATRAKFKCRHCHKQYSAKSAGAYRSSKLSLETIADITKLLSDKPRITVAAIARTHGLSYRGAYYLVQKIRKTREAT